MFDWSFFYCMPASRHSDSTPQTAGVLFSVFTATLRFARRTWHSGEQPRWSVATSWFVLGTGGLLWFSWGYVHVHVTYGSPVVQLDFMLCLCVCSSHETLLSMHQHPAQPVSVPLLHISRLRGQKNTPQRYYCCILARLDQKPSST